MQSRGRALLGCPLVLHLGTRHPPPPPHPFWSARWFQGRRRRRRFRFPIPVRRTIRSFLATRGRSSVRAQVPRPLGRCFDASDGLCCSGKGLRACVLALGRALLASDLRRLTTSQGLEADPSRSKRPSSPETKGIAGSWACNGRRLWIHFFSFLFCACWTLRRASGGRAVLNLTWHGLSPPTTLCKGNTRLSLGREGPAFKVAFRFVDLGVLDRDTS
ncbi:uncharacterized protein LY79DRAFT_357996 [Colletotrichum navitas]|uniref:Uncharacterized protein n=1 Tax=Colletotrichum navitas TaxID=681940 RepID=A0AAD8PS06_9PEZI|nr:uncharacterized protein LY79DRAFT_357996 [Colletotrichum navitas]KAK1579177.1 hypothetical protein LY79DRAFT_357996 [Colletotrichum navitas]